ncbi:TlyA family RNA methyltransferase [Demequina sp. TTPB684]|uniref:TlyA family RNA methyltransferase n=1 Tax=unclassified Demequina TaxID=2620311 RepID=UPI001CF34FA4|nr:MULTISPECIES: TlyA family RNA methyltransferase [unclassified Demequina]MCB2413872.1 TlyA family RNA methyltransferase [Demequina sp. TTPB684]UPU89440.1 TlyA family RNA methyltransferase [Demequina sp. TMPB413]
MRLDQAVYARALARSRSHAQDLIAKGGVLVDGEPETKPSRTVDADSVITLSGEADHYVSRAAHKLVGALDAFGPLGLAVEGKHALDVGASTGGFTQVLLERGVDRVTAVDVGHGQIAPELAKDPRVSVVEGLNVRDMEPGSPGTGAQVVVADLSFISLTMVVGTLRAVVAHDADFVLMVKPQFEVGKSGLDKHGVVSSPTLRAKAVAAVCESAQRQGLVVRALERSSLPGPSGNVEFFVWLSQTWQARGAAQERVLAGDALSAAISTLVEGTP